MIQSPDERSSGDCKGGRGFNGRVKYCCRKKKGCWKPCPVVVHCWKQQNVSPFHQLFPCDIHQTTDGPPIGRSNNVWQKRGVMWGPGTGVATDEELLKTLDQEIFGMLEKSNLWRQYGLQPHCRLLLVLECVHCLANLPSTSSLPNMGTAAALEVESVILPVFGINQLYPPPPPPPLRMHHYPVKPSFLEPCPVLPIQNSPPCAVVRPSVLVLWAVPAQGKGGGGGYGNLNSLVVRAAPLVLLLADVGHSGWL